MRGRETNRTTGASVELDRTATNSNELGRREKSDEHPMNYEEWPKSVELDRTVTPNFAVI